MSHPLWAMQHPWQFTELAPVPDDAVKHGKGTDIEGSLPVIWSLTMLLKPRVIVELGVRQATSTRTIADAAVKLNAEFYACDPDPSCLKFVQGFPGCQFFRMGGLEFYGNTLSTQKLVKDPVMVDLLMIDTDPHTYEQTMQWLTTWVEHRLVPGGCAMFHDIFPARQEIQVNEAVEHWLIEHPEWIWHKLSTDAQGLGLLWRPEA